MFSAYQTFPHQIQMVNGHSGWNIHQESAAELHQQPHYFPVLTCGSGDQRSREFTWQLSVVSGYSGLGSYSNSKQAPSRALKHVLLAVNKSKVIEQTALADVEQHAPVPWRGWGDPMAEPSFQSRGTAAPLDSTTSDTAGDSLCKLLQAERDIWKHHFAKG